MIDYIKKAFAWLTKSPKWAKILCPFLVACLVVVYLLSGCGTTRTTVRTVGKGTTNATISVTTNNPTRVSVETKIDSTHLKINKNEH